MNLLEDLQYRGLISQLTDEDGLEKILAEEKISLYCGYDPTADSLHIGHLLPTLMLRRFQQAGHSPVALVGGATGMIGDPSGKNVERTLNPTEVVAEWSDKIKNQLSRFLDFNAEENPATIANNYDWLGELDLISFLRDYGKSFGVNYMLAKETVQSRLESGISYSEFTYTILQSIDFLKLYETRNVRLQIGGSDQWGNITSGLELIRKSIDDAKAFGLTIPLVTKADGNKFGKTEGGAIWLDAEKTSPYEFYQFWINTDDRDVIKYLKYFTFLSKDQIEQLAKETEEAPHLRAAQRALAKDLTSLVHGEEALQQAIRISEALFSGNIKDLTGDEIEEGFKDVPSHEVTDQNIPLIDLLVEAKISPSKRQAREDVTNGAIYLNGDRITDLNYNFTAEDRIDEKYTIFRRGRRRYTLIKW